MGTIFRHTLARLRNQILAWGLTFGLLGWLLVAVFNSVVSQGSQYLDLVKQYPPAVMAFFGDMTQLLSPGGYLDTSLLSYGGLLICILAALLGSGLILSDEEAGRLEIVQSQPVSRTALFAGRGLATALGMLEVLALTWVGCVAGLPGSGFPVSPGSLLLPYVSLWSLMMLFAGLALCLSLVLPSRSAAASVTILIEVAAYTVTSLSRSVGSLKGLARLSPFNYYQSGYAVDGLNLGWCAGLLIASALFALLAWWAYQRRDLRVSGEGSWRG